MVAPLRAVPLLPVSLRLPVRGRGRRLLLIARRRLLLIACRRGLGRGSRPTHVPPAPGAVDSAVAVRLAGDMVAPLWAVARGLVCPSGWVRHDRRARLLVGGRRLRWLAGGGVQLARATALPRHDKGGAYRGQHRPSCSAAQPPLVPARQGDVSLTRRTHDRAPGGQGRVERPCVAASLASRGRERRPNRTGPIGSHCLLRTPAEGHQQAPCCFRVEPRLVGSRRDSLLFPCDSISGLWLPGRAPRALAASSVGCGSIEVAEDVAALGAGHSQPLSPHVEPQRRTSPHPDAGLLPVPIRERRARPADERAGGPARRRLPHPHDNAAREGVAWLDRPHLAFIVPAKEALAAAHREREGA